MGPAMDYEVNWLGQILYLGTSILCQKEHLAGAVTPCSSLPLALSPHTWVLGYTAAS